MTNNPKTISRKTLARELSIILGKTNAEATEFIETFMNIYKNHLRNGEVITLKEFGVARLVEKKERVGRNPKTGKPMKIPARIEPQFEFSKKFREEIRDLYDEKE